MTAFVLTLVLLGVLLLITRALLRRSRLAIGVAIGAAAALPCAAILASIESPQHIPIWLPALPFAIAAVTLFAFGVVAWFWPVD